MSRTMYDSVTPTNIPVNAAMVAGYINGTWQWTAAEWARFPHATKVRIATRFNVNDGHVIDVETGAAWPPQPAVDWVLMRRRAGVDPTVYCNASTWPSVRAAFDARGVAQPHYWIAKYDGNPTIPAGAVAKQHTGDASPGIDISSVADYWPGVDQAPPVQQTPTPGYQEENAMNVDPGAFVRTPIPCNGARQLFIGTGFGNVVDGKLWFVTDTNPNTETGSYVGQLGTPLHIDSDRPGPVAVPAGCRFVSLESTSDVAFTAWCA